MRHQAPSRTFKARLDALERQSRATLAISEVELATLATPETGETENDATRLLAVGLLADVLEREWKELTEIAATRRRIADGRFGRCEACGRDIGRARLRAVPTARHCVTCQAEMECRSTTWARAA